MEGSNDAADLDRLRRDQRLARVEVGGAREGRAGCGPIAKFGLGSVGSVATAVALRVLTERIDQKFKSSKGLTGTFKIANKFVKR